MLVLADADGFLAFALTFRPPSVNSWMASIYLKP
jgi:hypothetical protein